MKKRLLALILAACVTMSVTACQDNQNTSSAPTSSVTESKDDSKTESEESKEESSDAETSAPESSDSETSAPESSDAETSAPETSDVETAAPESSDVETTTSETTTDKPSDVPTNEVYEAGGLITEGMKEISVLNEGNKVRLAKVLKKLAAGEEVTIGYIGGSLLRKAHNRLVYEDLPQC